jgi:hypothetical protein
MEPTTLTEVLNGSDGESSIQLYKEQKMKNKLLQLKNEYIKLQMMEFYMTNRGLTCSEIIICVLDASFDAGIASIFTVIFIHGIDRIDKYLRNKAGEVVEAVVEGAQMVGGTVVDAAETVRDNSVIVDEGATLIGNIITTSDWLIGGVFGSINVVFDYGSKAQTGKVACPFCEESTPSPSITLVEHISNTIQEQQVIQPTMETLPILQQHLYVYDWMCDELTSIPGMVLCLVFLWKLKIYYVQERAKKERLRTSVVFGELISPGEKKDISQKKDSTVGQFIRSI